MAQATQEKANLTDVKLYDIPRCGFWRGRTVTIEGVGNQEGHSPAFLVVDERGQSQIASLNEVTVLGMLLIPPTIEQIQRAVEQGQTGTTTR